MLIPSQVTCQAVMQQAVPAVPRQNIGATSRACPAGRATAAAASASAAATTSPCADLVPNP